MIKRIIKFFKEIDFSKLIVVAPDPLNKVKDEDRDKYIIFRGVIIGQKDE